MAQQQAAVSIHAPVTGATMQGGKSVAEYLFQSTRP